jgi:CubicO group peptidase (beta-lactamase class C family)
LDEQWLENTDMHLTNARAALVAGALCLVAPHVVAGTAEEQTPPETVWPTKTWEISTPEEQGLDSGALARLVDNVGARQQDSLLIVRHGKVVAEVYYAPYEAGIRHDLRSVTKSIVGTLTAIAIRDGSLDGVDHPIADLFSDKQISNVDENKKAITVQSLLDMTSGIDWQEKAYTPDETIMRMYRSPDPTGFVLNQPMSKTPGTQFYYNSGNPYVLSALITKKTGRSALKFAEDTLFEPLGISSVRWGRVDAQGVKDGSSGLYLQPRDMAKIGYLYLRNGVWDGKRIIPSSWVDRVKEGKVKATQGLHYANLWWSLPERGAYMALGRHSQLIVVLPTLDIIAVMTGSMRDDEYYPIAKLIDDISNSVRSDKPLPPDAVARSLLAASIRQAAAERPSPFGETSELAKTISGKCYQFGSNALQVKTLSLDLADPNPKWEITIDTEKSDQPTERLGGPIGLDGVFRKNASASYGIHAVKGRWLNEHTFAVEHRILGHGETQFWTLRFDHKTVDISFENTDGFKTELHGEEKD